MQFVPMATPFMWFCFNEAQSIRRWTEAYIENRPFALSQMAQPFATTSMCEVTNPAWQPALAEHGLLLGTTATESKPAKQDKQLTAREQKQKALAAFIGGLGELNI
jgi:hypothetical protein